MKLLWSCLLIVLCLSISCKKVDNSSSDKPAASIDVKKEDEAKKKTKGKKPASKVIPKEEEEPTKEEDPKEEDDSKGRLRAHRRHSQNQKTETPKVEVPLNYPQVLRINKEGKLEVGALELTAFIKSEEGKALDSIAVVGTENEVHYLDLSVVKNIILKLQEPQDPRNMEEARTPESAIKEMINSLNDSNAMKMEDGTGFAVWNSNHTDVIQQQLLDRLYFDGTKLYYTKNKVEVSLKAEAKETVVGRKYNSVNSGPDDFKPMPESLELDFLGVNGNVIDTELLVAMIESDQDLLKKHLLYLRDENHGEYTKLVNEITQEDAGATSSILSEIAPKN